MYSIYHFFDHLNRHKTLLRTVPRLQDFPFDPALLSARSVGVFPDLALRLTVGDPDFTGGELIELKDSQTYGIPSFNSTIPTGTKDVRAVAPDAHSAIYQQMSAAGDDVYSLPTRDVYYLLRGRRREHVKVCLVHGSFFETVAVERLIQGAFAQVLDDFLRSQTTPVTDDQRAAFLALFTEQENFSKVRNVEGASVKLRFRVMTEAKAQGNVLNPRYYPQIADDTLNFLAPCHDDDQRQRLEARIARAAHVRRRTGARVCAASRAQWSVSRVSGSAAMTRFRLLTLALLLSALTCAFAQPARAAYDKFALWSSGSTTLRGANLWMRVRVPQLDGDEFLGDGYVGPPYTQADFDRLAAEGANYVSLSIPGLFTMMPPYVLDEGVQAVVDDLVAKAQAADLFVTLSVRTGPGRSDFTFYRAGAGDSFDAALLVEDIWTNPAAQNAWVEMWRVMAARYRDNAVVVGYEPMVEPNGNNVLYDEYDPETFFAAYRDTLADWNPLALRLVAAIREVDADTPILIGAQSWSSADWLATLPPIDDPHIVYVVHQYIPHPYTHQDGATALLGTRAYPGFFDVDYDGDSDVFDADWLEAFYARTIDPFVAARRAPVAVNEYGVHRFAPGAADFMRDQMAVIEARGMNHAFWMWYPDLALFRRANSGFDMWGGANPLQAVVSDNSDLVRVIRADWAQNTLRPSNVGG